MIGVLGYQGGATLHIDALKKLHIPCKKVYYFDNLEELDGLILPGGESSVQYQYCKKYRWSKKLIQFSQMGKPILGTCAGSILLSHFQSDKLQGLRLIDIDIERNIYGRQIYSGIKISDLGNKVMFIRAPGVTRVGQSVVILDSYQKKPIFLKQKNIYCTTFHPELVAVNTDNIIYTLFGRL